MRGTAKPNSLIAMCLRHPPHPAAACLSPPRGEGAGRQRFYSIVASPCAAPMPKISSSQRRRALQQFFHSIATGPCAKGFRTEAHRCRKHLLPWGRRWPIGRMRGTAQPSNLIDNVPAASPSSRCRDLLPQGEKGSWGDGHALHAIGCGCENGLRGPPYSQASTRRLTAAKRADSIVCIQTKI